MIPASWRKPVIDFIDVIARKPQLRGGDINADERLLCARSRQSRLSWETQTTESA